MTRLANESDDMTKNMNVTLLGDREKLINIKKAVESVYGFILRMKEYLEI